MQFKGTDDPQPCVCVLKAISYKCPYVLVIVVQYQIYTAVMITICVKQKKSILFRLGVLRHLYYVTSLVTYSIILCV